MKIFKLLTICLVVCCLFTSNVFAAVCTVRLNDELFPNNGIVKVGDTIEYEITIEIADEPDTCDLDQFAAYFLNPTDESGDACIDSNSIQLPLPTTLSQGDVYFFTSPSNAKAGTADATIAALAYVVQEGDIVDGKIIAKLCSSWDPDTDSKTVRNTVIDPNICVDKSVECDISAPGYEVDYKILIENCGDTELELVSVIDSLADDLTAAAIAAGCEFLAPDGEPNSSCEIIYSLEVLLEDLLPEPNLINDVNVIYSVIGTDITLQGVDDVVVDLIDPNFTVMKECVDEPIMVGADANFLITIENIGTVDLILYSPEIVIDPNLLPAGQTYTDNVLQTVETCDDARNTIFVDAILPPELCFALDEPLVESASASCEVIDPNFTVEKNCLNDPVPADANAMFEIIITNTSCGEVVLFFDVNDPAAPHINGSYGPISPLGTVEIPIELPADCEVDESIINIVYVEAFYDSNSIGEKEAEAECPVEPCGGDEGCTPGYWKNSPDCWCDAYIGNPKLCTIFDLNCDTTPNDFFEKMGQKKMMAALSFKGGSKKKYKFRILLKHAVAALLNACNDDVNYPVSESYIIDSVDHIINNWGDYSKSEILSLKNEFDTYNNLGCPISADNAPEGIACERHDD